MAEYLNKGVVTADYKVGAGCCIQKCQSKVNNGYQSKQVPDPWFQTHRSYRKKILYGAKRTNSSAEGPSEKQGKAQRYGKKGNGSKWYFVGMIE